MVENVSGDTLSGSDRIQDRYLFTTDKIVSVFEREIEKNRIALPDFLDISVVKDENLYSIYKEAYSCVLLGLYNAGLILMGQLMEITLKEIILINTGTALRGTFGKALGIADKGKIMSPEDIEFLYRFKNTIRDPYTHRNFRDILGYELLPAWSFHVGSLDSEEKIKEFLNRMEKINSAIKRNEVPLQFIDPAKSSGTAIVRKLEIDPQRAIHWAWLVFMEFEFYIAKYLRQERYEEYTRKFGSPLDKIAQISIDEDDE